MLTYCNYEMQLLLFFISDLTTLEYDSFSFVQFDSLIENSLSIGLARLLQYAKKLLRRYSNTFPQSIISWKN